MRAGPRPVPPLLHEGVRYEVPHWGLTEPEPEPPADPPLVESDPARALERAGYSAEETAAMLERQRGEQRLTEAVDEVRRAEARQRMQSVMGAVLSNPDSALQACQDVLGPRLAGGPPVGLEALRERLGDDGLVRAWEAAGYRIVPDVGLRVELAQRGTPRAEIEVAVRRQRLSEATSAAMQTITQEQMARMLSGAMSASSDDDLLSHFDPARVRELLVEQRLEPAEIEEALAAFEMEMATLRQGLAQADLPPRQVGGLVVAYAADSGALLWQSRAYGTEYDPNLETCVQDVFITHLEVDGQHLVVRDERRRLHRLDLRTGELVGSEVDTRPTPADLVVQALRELPQAQREHLWEQLWAMKGHLDQHNFSAYGLAEAPAQELEAALDRFLTSLGNVRGLEAAWRAGVKHAAAIRQGEDPHVLYNWLQEELKPVFLELFPSGSEDAEGFGG